MAKSGNRVRLFGEVAMATVMPTNRFMGHVRVNHANFVTTAEIIDIIEKRAALRDILKEAVDDGRDLPEAIWEMKWGQEKVSAIADRLSELQDGIEYFEAQGLDIAAYEGAYRSGAFQGLSKNQQGLNKIHILSWNP